MSVSQVLTTKAIEVFEIEAIEVLFEKSGMGVFLYLSEGCWALITKERSLHRVVLHVFLHLPFFLSLLTTDWACLHNTVNRIVKLVVSLIKETTYLYTIFPHKNFRSFLHFILHPKCSIQLIIHTVPAFLHHLGVCVCAGTLHNFECMHRCL